MHSWETLYPRDALYPQELSSKNDLHVYANFQVQFRWYRWILEGDWACAGGGGCAASASPGFMQGQAYGRSSKTESDWLLPGKNILDNSWRCIKCTISPRARLTPTVFCYDPNTTDPQHLCHYRLSMYILHEFWRNCWWRRLLLYFLPLLDSHLYKNNNIFHIRRSKFETAHEIMILIS